MEKKIYRITETKQGRKWTETNRIENAEDVYKILCMELIAKKINCCTWVKSIKRVNLYNGFEKITVTYNNDTRSIYQIEEH